MKVKILHFVLVFLLFIPLGFSLFPNRPYYNSTCEQLCESFGYSYGICRGYSLGSNITRIGGCKDNETSIGQTSDCYTPRGLVGGGKFCCCGGTSRAAVSNISCETDEDCPQPRCVGGKASCVNGVCILTSFCADPTQSRACEDDSDCVFRNDLCGCYNKDFVPPGNLPDIYCGEILGVDDIPNCRCESGTALIKTQSQLDTSTLQNYSKTQRSISIKQLLFMVFLFIGKMILFMRVVADMVLFGWDQRNIIYFWFLKEISKEKVQRFIIKANR